MSAAGTAGRCCGAIGMGRMKRRMLLGLLLGWTAPWSFGMTAAHALDAPAASALVMQASGDAVAALTARDLTTEQRADAVRALITRYSNEEELAAETLGRAWLSASTDEKSRFEARFVDYIVAVCTGMMKETPPAMRVVVKDTEPHGKLFVVHSVVLVGNDPTPVDWSVGASADGRPFLADVSAEGVGLIRTMSSDFRAVLFANAGRIDALMAAMDKVAGAN